MGSSIIGGPRSGSSYVPPPPQPSGSGPKIPILFGAVAALLVATIYLFYQLSRSARTSVRSFPTRAIRSWRSSPRSMRPPASPTRPARRTSRN